MSNDSVKVAVRIRPLVKSEITRGCENIVQKTPLQPQVVINSSANDSVFTYNYVFAPEDTQEMVYENAVKSMVLNLFKGKPKFSYSSNRFCYRSSDCLLLFIDVFFPLGYNVTILAYGQTGSGKTHTMGTNWNGIFDDDIGVIPRAINDIFNKIEEMTEYDFNINCAFIELYQERLYDLLSSNPREQSVVDIREDQNSRIIIPNLTEIMVKSAKDTTNCLMRGSADRAVGATAMNAQSSRSHAIFTITVQKVKKDDLSTATSAKFHLVDLAGSERSKKTQTTGEQFKEGVKINQGLLALGNVISALGSNLGSVHVGYRDSKLTRLLQDSLGGNSMTLMIACISPADYNMEESLGTLRYADRARKIKNKPIVNEDPKTAEINKLKAEIQALRIELLSKSGAGIGIIGKCEECERPPKKADLHRQLREMAEKLQITLSDIVNRENIINEYEDTIESLNQKIVQLKEQITNLDNALTADMSPEDFTAYKENVRALTDTILSLNNHMNERKETILENSKASESFMGNQSRSSSLVSHEEELVQNNKEYIEKQVTYQDELKDIKAQIAMKEELHKKLFTNFQQFCTLDVENNELNKIHDYETAIAKLEKEKEELKGLLHNKNTTVSVKLAEERRKRVQHLESEIAEMKKKNKQQALLLKQREKDVEKITKLNNEIQEMKQLKVKLIRKMKSESEEFRQWRQIREKELVQLRAKDRKMQTEAAKKDMLHEKQRNVLKRKVEEANAANKRLKDALLKQKTSKAKKPGLNRSSSWIMEELEVINSIIDIKQSFEQLFEVRADLNQRLNKLRADKSPDKEQIKALQEEIEMRSAQIADLNGKINAHDLDAKSKAIYESVQSIPEGRSIIKQLLNSVIEMRGNFNTYFAQARDTKHLLEVSEERQQQLEQEFKQKIDQMVQEHNQVEKENQEKIGMLLQALSSKGTQSDIVNIMEAELANKNKEIEELRKQLQHGNTRKKPRYLEVNIHSPHNPLVVVMVIC